MAFVKNIGSPVDELRDIGRKIEDNAKKATKLLEEAKEQAQKLTKVVDWLKALWDKVRPWLIIAVIVCALVMLWPLFTLLSTIRAALGSMVWLVGLDGPPR